MVTAAGGRGIAVRTDHADDEQVKALFVQIEREHGRLDILVNNAAIIRDEMMGRTKFWEEPIAVPWHPRWRGAMPRTAVSRPGAAPTSRSFPLGRVLRPKLLHRGPQLRRKLALRP